MVYTPTNPISLRLQLVDSGNNVINSSLVTVNKNNQFTVNMLSTTVLENTATLRISINTESSSYCYFDDFNLTIQ